MHFLEFQFYSLSMGSTANRMRIEILLTGSNGVGKTALATQYQQHVFTFGVVSPGLFEIYISSPCLSDAKPLLSLHHQQEQICETALRKQITIDDRVALLDVLDCAAELNRYRVVFCHLWINMKYSSPSLLIFQA